MEFKKELLTNDRLCVIVKNEHEARELLDWAGRNGKRWCCSGELMSERFIYCHENGKQCYCIAGGHQSEYPLEYIEIDKYYTFEEAKERRNLFKVDLLNYDITITEAYKPMLKEMLEYRWKNIKENKVETLEQLKERQAKELKALEEQKKAEEKAEAERLQAEIDEQIDKVKRIIMEDRDLGYITDLMCEIKNPALSLRYKTLKKARNERIDEIIAIAETMKK